MQTVLLAILGLFGVGIVVVIGLGLPLEMFGGWWFAGPVIAGLVLVLFAIDKKGKQDEPPPSL